MRFSVAFIGLVFVIFDAQGLLRGTAAAAAVRVPRDQLRVPGAADGGGGRVRAGAARVKSGGRFVRACRAPCTRRPSWAPGWGTGRHAPPALAGRGRGGLDRGGRRRAPCCCPCPRCATATGVCRWRWPPRGDRRCSSPSCSVRFDLVQASALYGLRMELPPPRSVAGFAYVIAFFAWPLALLQLSRTKGGMRLAALRPGAAGAGRLRRRRRPSSCPCRCSACWR